MRELRRRVALARDLRAASKRGRRDVAVYRSVREEPPLAAGRLLRIGPRAARVGPARVRWSEIGRVEAVPSARCRNCLREHGPLEACLVGVLAGVVIERGAREAIRPELLARVEVDELWDRHGGPAADWLEDHLRWLEADGEV